MLSPSPDRAVARFAPAKVNLALHVTGRRPDGYHDIETLAVFSRFGDRLTVEPAERDGLNVTGRFAAGVPLDETNLVLRALAALRELRGRDLPPVAITIEKNLPVASGLGGGSSDAAAALHALVRLWALDVDEATLSNLGAALGADLPMCLFGRAVVARGVGERLAPVADAPALALVLVNPGVAVSTADVFRNLASRDNGPLPPLPARFDFHGLRNWLAATRNDLEVPARAIAPEIGQAIATLDRAGSGISRMSGSGATCFGLFETGNVAKRAALAIRQRNPEWFVAATRTLASGDDNGEA